MERLTVSEARALLEELLQALHSAYWDSSEITHKDMIYDTVSMIYGELLEISKLSVHDYDMGYEPITAQFPACVAKFKHLQQNVDLWFHRSETEIQMHNALAKVVNLTSSKTY